jgi:D-alanyl-D-alanine carboxypeptidase (penicillin-binding protein 5/6)
MEKGKNPPAPRYFKNFYSKMNRLGKELGLEHSSFQSAHGLSNEANVSTALDLCRLSAAALQHPLFLKIVSAESYQCPIFNERSGLTRTETWVNSNRLLREKGFQGIKTGITPAAGPCFAGYY